MTKYQNYTLLAFLFIAFEAISISFIDLPLSLYMRTLDQTNHQLIDFFRAYTDAGKSKWYLCLSSFGFILCAILMRIKPLWPNWREQFRRIGEKFFFFFICVALSGIASDIIKPIIGRARPVIMDREGFYGFHPFTHDAAWNSWPSGHATSAVTIAYVLMGFFPRWCWLWIAFAVAIGVSRIMVNAHYLADVVAGAVLAILTVQGLHWLFNRNGMFHIKYVIFPIDGKTTSL